MISKFTLENFKSYHQATLPLAPLTLLIGANASGKSNAIEGLQILSGIARASEIYSEIERLEYQGFLRGPSGEFFYKSWGAFTLGCAMEYDSPWRNLKIKLQQQAMGIVVVEESILSPTENRPLYRIVPDSLSGDTMMVEYNPFDISVPMPTISTRSVQAVFTQLTTPARFADKHTQAQKQIPVVAQAIQQSLTKILFFDPAPQLMRSYNSLYMKNVLQRQGKNISSVLYELCQDPAQKEQVLAFIRSLPEQNIRDIDFIITQRNDVLLRLIETFGGNEQPCDAPNLSDGTLRVLAIAAALLSAPEGSLVVIEEIDNGIHPSRADILMKNIQQIVNERHIRVLLTTHNPALMDALPLEAIPNVVYCYRDPEQGDSRLVRLADLEDYPRLIAQGNVGGLITRGILEQRFKEPPPPPEEQVARALAWLQNLEAEVQAQ